jgi:hypothetical protein
MLSNFLAFVGIACTTVAAALVDPAAGFAVAGAWSVYVSREVAK